MKKLKRFIQPYYLKLFLAGGSKGIGALCDVYLPIVMSQILAIVNTARLTETEPNMTSIYTLVGVMLAVTAFSGFCNYYANTRAAYASENVGNDIRKALYQHKLSLSIHDLQSVSYAELTTKIVYDVDTVAKFLGMSAKMIVRQSVLAIGGLFVAISIDPYITAVLLVTMTTMVIISRTIFKTTGKWHRKASEGIDQSSSIIRESITGIKTIKSFAKQEKEESKFKRKIQDIYDNRVTAGTVDAILPASITIISNATITAIMLVSGWRVNNGDLDPIRLTAFVVYINLFIGAMVSLSRVMVRFAKTNSCIRRINELFDITPTVNEINDQKADHDYVVKVENLNFAYDQTPVLSDISFTLKKGESLGIVGQTGCGKTTLVEILTGIYNDYTGNIFVNQQNIRNTAPADIAKSIGVARQKFDVFTGTVESNIILNKDFDQTTFDSAANLSQISNFINRKGKDLHIKQSGTNLSGGQRQRVNLARLFYNNPDILVLDDVSSALDTATNAKLNAALAQVTGSKSVIYISNKIDSIKHFDKIIVLENGRITGYDTHDNLMLTNDCYQELASNQHREEVVYE